MTLGQALAAKVRLMVWCKVCGHRAEPAVTDQAARYGPDATARTRSSVTAATAPASV